MKHVMLIFGTRPEAIKMAPLVKELENRKDTFTVSVCVTAQHREMLDQVLEVFKITPDFDVNIMKKGQTLSDITTRVIDGVGEILRKHTPDIVLVHGDTTTTMASGLAAFYHNIPVGHVEAGLRTYDKSAPFPEEVNRQIVGSLSDYHFAPTELAKKNLTDEHKKSDTIYVTGNTAIDAMRYTVINEFSDEIMQWVGEERFILLTAHRRENLGNPMRDIFSAINEITEKHTNVKVVFPVHLNPVVKELAQEILANNEKVRLIDPLDVRTFHNYMAKSHIILTDSGGIQEEAPSLGKPVLVLRDVTERPEGIKAGTLVMVGTDKEKIINTVDELLSNETYYESFANAKNPYGDGKASERIADILST